jgi:hypothetical protein
MRLGRTVECKKNVSSLVSELAGYKPAKFLLYDKWRSATMQTRTSWRRPLRPAVAKLGGAAEDPEDPRKGGPRRDGSGRLFSNVDEMFKHQQGSVLGQAVLVAGTVLPRPVHHQAASDVNYHVMEDVLCH